MAPFWFTASISPRSAPRFTRYSATTFLKHRVSGLFAPLQPSKNGVNDSSASSSLTLFFEDEPTVGSWLSENNLQVHAFFSSLRCLSLRSRKLTVCVSRPTCQHSDKIKSRAKNCLHFLTAMYAAPCLCSCFGLSCVYYNMFSLKFNWP